MFYTLDEIKLAKYYMNFYNDYMHMFNFEYNKIFSIQHKQTLCDMIPQIIIEHLSNINSLLQDLYVELTSEHDLTSVVEPLENIRACSTEFVMYYKNTLCYEKMNDEKYIVFYSLIHLFDIVYRIESFFFELFNKLKSIKCTISVTKNNKVVVGCIQLKQVIL
jgi:hypothetical protein